MSCATFLSTNTLRRTNGRRSIAPPKPWPPFYRPSRAFSLPPRNQNTLKKVYDFPGYFRGNIPFGEFSGGNSVSVQKFLEKKVRRPLFTDQWRPSLPPGPGWPPFCRPPRAFSPPRQTRAAACPPGYGCAPQAPPSAALVPARIF